MRKKFKPSDVGSYVLFKGYDDGVTDPLFQAGERIRLTAVYVDTSNSSGFTAASGRLSDKGIRLLDTVFENEISECDDQTPFENEVDSPIEIEGEPKAKKARGTLKVEKAEKTEKPAKVEKVKAEKVKAVLAVIESTPGVEPVVEPVALVPVTDTVTDDDAVVGAPAQALANAILGVEAPIPAVAPQAPIGDELRSIREAAEVEDDKNAIVESSPAVLAALESTGQDALLAASALLAQAEQGYFTLGGVLHYIERTGAYKPDVPGVDQPGRHRSFIKYCEIELGFSHRRAKYLMTIYRVFTKRGLDETRLATIGWAKAKELMALKDSPELVDDFDELVEFAETHTREELTAHCKGIVSGRENTSVAVMGDNAKVPGFTVRGEEAALFRAALTTAGPRAGVSVPAEDMSAEQSGTVIRFIVAEWAALSDGTVPPLLMELQRLERVYDVKVTATPLEDEETEQVHTTA